MTMQNRDSNPSNISPDDWERIARYITGEASSAESEATRGWLEADSHRRAVVDLLDTVVANVGREGSSEVDVERALTRVKARFDDPKIIPFARRLAAHDSRSRAALIRIA